MSAANTLSESASKQLLAGYGLPLLDEAVVETVPPLVRICSMSPNTESIGRVTGTGPVWAMMRRMTPTASRTTNGVGDEAV